MNYNIVVSCYSLYTMQSLWISHCLQYCYNEIRPWRLRPARALRCIRCGSWLNTGLLLVLEASPGQSFGRQLICVPDGPARAMQAAKTVRACVLMMAGSQPCDGGQPAHR